MSEMNSMIKTLNTWTLKLSCINKRLKAFHQDLSVLKWSLQSGVHVNDSFIHMYTYIWKTFLKFQPGPSNNLNLPLVWVKDLGKLQNRARPTIVCELKAAPNWHPFVSKQLRQRKLFVDLAKNARASFTLWRHRR